LKRLFIHRFRILKDYSSHQDFKKAERFMIALFILMMVLQMTADSSSGQPTAYQSLEYQIKDRNFKTTFDPSSGDIYLYHGTDRTIVRLTENGTTDTLGTIPQSYDGLIHMEITSDGESIYFWENGIGRVHRYDIATNTIEREDKSHSHRTMFGHAGFLSDDKFIYAMGGYGYWEFRNFLIRYEPEFGQWEKVPSLNDELVVRSWKGLLYKLGNSFYYFVDNTNENGNQKTHAYRYDLLENKWFIEHGLEETFKPFEIMNRGVSRTFVYGRTYMVDKNNRHLGFLSSTTQNIVLNLVSVDESAIYQLNIDLLGINDVRAVFYSDRIDRWVLLGHESAWTERTTLRAYLFEFDENHPFITVYTPESTIPAESIFLTAGGTLAAGIIGFFLYIILIKRKTQRDEDHNGEDIAQNKPVEIFKNSDGEMSVYINGNRFKTSEDQTLRELWTIIAERVETGDSSILVSNIDQRLYPSQSHASYNSRNRKKLLKIINSACGFDLISEERSKIDKRYKVLTIKTDKITIKQG